jgi:magnesium chelatase subunit D
MNQEEGELRPQLLDRFGLMVEVSAPADRHPREVVRRRIAFEADPQAFTARWQAAAGCLRAQVARPSAMLPAWRWTTPCWTHQPSVLRVRSGQPARRHRHAQDRPRHRRLQARTQVTPTTCAPPPAGAATPPPPQAFRAGGMDQDKLDDLVDQARQPQPPPAAGRHDAAPGEQEGHDRMSQQEQQSSSTNREGEGGQQTFAVAPQVRPARSAWPPQQSRPRPAAAAARWLMPAGAAPCAPCPTPIPTAWPSVPPCAAPPCGAPCGRGGGLTVTRADLHARCAAAAGQPDRLRGRCLRLHGRAARMEAGQGHGAGLLTDAYQRRDQLAVIAFRGRAGATAAGAHPQVPTWPSRAARTAHRWPHAAAACAATGAQLLQQPPGQREHRRCW